MLQKEILGARALHYGLRESPIFVGEVVRYKNVVQYVAPHYAWLSDMMHALNEALVRTASTHPLIRAAVFSFGFVYIHPLTDGNGRISRFLINDILRRDGVVKEPYIVPVSAIITKDMASYDRALDIFSAPFRSRYSQFFSFGKEARYPDGRISNFEFSEYEDAAHAWKYLDLTDHVPYLANIISETIRKEMHEEAAFLRRHYQLRRKLDALIQAGDNDLDRIIRSVSENRQITGKLKAEYPLLEDEELGARVVEAVLADMEDGAGT